MYSVLITFLLVLFFAVAFSLQNSEPIILNFFSWTFQGSLVVVLLTALACGVMLSIVASLPSFIKKSRLITQQQKTIAQLERTVAEEKRLSVNPDPL
ncbi:MAG: LapA family protein [Nitrospirota bacterium]|nr:LapA family protein [Nitrospirota bacterium]